MKNCWDLDPLKRPSASELQIIITNWLDKFDNIRYDKEGVRVIVDEEVRKHFETIENEQLRKDIEELWKSNKHLKQDEIIILVIVNLLLNLIRKHFMQVDYLVLLNNLMIFFNKKRGKFIVI